MPMLIIKLIQTSILTFTLSLTLLCADIQILSDNIFFDTETNNITIHDNFILVSVREKNSDGRLYHIINGELIHSDVISSGGQGKETPQGIFKISRKIRKYMSRKYPSSDGINNMDYSLFFNKGIALHQGNNNYTSNGCIHIDKSYAKLIFDNSKLQDTVIITKDSYFKYLTQEQINQMNQN